MESALRVLVNVLLVLFAVGVVGCLLVIPATALQLFKAVVEPDTDDETAPNNTQRLETIS